MAAAIDAEKTQVIPMAPIDEAGFPSDETRAQELDQYFNPSNKSMLRLTERDTALGAHMQLIAWRLDVQRALVTLIDRDSQYFIAECTKTLNLRNPDDLKDRSDVRAALNTSDPRMKFLCSQTLQATSNTDEEPAYFEVCDLTADPNFADLGLVRDLHLLYYCGVPICTRKGINIGTMFVLDDKARKPLCLQQLRFLESMADNVMVHLETRKQQMDVARIMRMNKSLAEFVDAGQIEQTQIVPKNPFFEKPGSQGTKSTNHGNQSSSDDNSSEDEVPEGNEAKDYNEIFSRAAALLRKSLSLKHDGGVLFLDTAPKCAGRTSTRRTMRSESGSKCVRHNSKMGTFVPSRSHSDETANEGEGSQVDAAVLARSVCPASFSQTDQVCQPNETPHKIPTKILMKFIKKAPAGNIWHYPELRKACTGEPRNPSNPASHGNLEESEVRTLFSHLPGAHEVVFVPFWNTHLCRWSVCIVYTLTTERNFSYEIDYFFCRAFCNCVKAEIDRCTVTVSDQQKGDFIGSVSHELRSPLHGILASCELIQETEMTAFQASLIDTTQSCAHTLLDTIQMVLEFSKVNAVAKDQTGQSLNINPQVSKNGVEPLLSTYSHVNVAVIGEEVIEGVTTGHLARNDPKPEPEASEEKARRDARTPEGSLQIHTSPVEIILDISPPQDWTFMTQPGAYRRILMNLFGNSLKYTDHGYIKIFLRCEEMDQNSSEAESAMVAVTVTDSGKGISQQYMETRMFTSFAQENPLAPGTGLGLSLVKSLVDMMHGEIEFRSEINKGTTVTVRIPMKRATKKPRDGSHNSSSAKDIETLRTIEPRPQIVNFQQDDLPDDTSLKREAYQMQKHALAAYVNGWFHIQDLGHWDLKTRPDVIIVDDVHLLAITKHLEILEGFDAAVVVLCSDRSQTTTITKALQYSKLHVMPKPFGPFKLAKVLKLSLTKPGFEPNSSVPTITEPPQDGKRTAGPRSLLKRANSFSQSLSKRLEPGESSSDRMFGPAREFPFPCVSDTTTSGSPNNAVTSPQIEVPGVSHQVFKSLDVPLSQQGSKQKHDELIRSVSDSQILQKQRDRKPRMLLVDDNEVNLKLLQTFFIRRGYKDLKLARDGKQAVEAYKDAMMHSRRFHLLWMDIQMPLVDGFEATSIVRQIESSATPQHIDCSTKPFQSLIIALTGNASAEDQKNAFTHGMDFYMTKPVSLKDIGELMEAWEESSAKYGLEGARWGLLESNAAGE